MTASDTERATRLAEALRSNLRRRKAQARASVAHGPGDAAAPLRDAVGEQADG